jgi:AcrR family transcriptional regulator
MRGEEPTARTIAASAGIAPATVYRYFPDVDSVLDALVHEHAAVAEATVAAALSTDTSTDARSVFRLVIETYLSLYRRRSEFTVEWRSAVMAERQRLVEERSDRGLAHRLCAHLVARGLVLRHTAELESRIETHWHMAGVAIGALLRAGPKQRAAAERDLWAFVDHAAATLVADR